MMSGIQQSEDDADARGPEPCDRTRLQRDFFERLGASQPLRDLFEHIPEYAVFVKDGCGRIICANRPTLLRLGVTREDEVIGTTAHDHFPPGIADDLARDERRVMESGEPILHRVGVWFDERHVLSWCVSTTLPMRDPAGRPIGVMGTVRGGEGGRPIAGPCAAINRAIEYIRAHPRDRIGADQLAKASGLSPRQLRRRFLEAYGMGIRDFLAKTRMQAAYVALADTDLPIALIAIDCGFCDQSAFTQQFRKHAGMTPLRYRRAYGRGPEPG